MNSQDIKTVTLVINSDQAKKKLEDISKRMEAVRAKREEAFSKGDAKGIEVYTRELRNLERQAARMQGRAQTVEKVLKNLDRATPNELKRTIREISRELDRGSAARGTKEWNSLSEALARAQSELDKINEEQNAAKRNLSEEASLFGQNWVGFTTILTQASSAFSAMLGKVMGFYQQYADMAEHMVSVKKYTGLTDEAVRDLNESFKQMDTRTAREQLNDLAGDAGRLGIQGKKDILEFVEAADQINVALGEDLGEDAVKNIGKLAQLFGDADRMGLKQAMLSTGSVINELAQSSSASEGYLMDFTARLAGVGHQAGMTQAQVMAFGSILDQGMVNVEKGATALQNTITALYRKPQEMARLAGLEVKEFTTLLKTDGNAAVMEFVSALNRSGNMDKLAPMLDDMKLSGAGVTQTLSTLAMNIDSLRETQAQATQAFQEGTSVTQEFNTANNTAQAELDKLKKQTSDCAIAIGEQLQPVALGMLNLSSSILRILSTIIPFVTTHIGLIVRLSAAIAAYTIILQAAAIKTALVTAAQKYMNAVMVTGRTIMATMRALVLVCSIAYNTMTGNIARATAAQRLLNTTILKNPYAAVAAVLLTVVFAISEMITRTKKLTEEQKAALQVQKDLQDIHTEAAKSTVDEKMKIEALTTIIRDNSRSIASRKKAIDDLRKIIPDYHGEINREGVLIKNNTDAIDAYIKKLDEMALAAALYEKLKKNAEEQIDADLAVKAWQRGVNHRQGLMNDKSRPRWQKVEMTPYMPGVASQTTSVIDYDEMSLRHDKERLAYWKKRSEIAKESKKQLMDYAKANNLTEALEKVATGGGTSVPGPSSDLGPGNTGSGKGGKKGKADGNARELAKANRAAEKEYDRAATIMRQKVLDDYAAGAVDLLQYREQMNAISEQSIEQKRDLYAKDSEEWKKHNDDLLNLQREHSKQSEDWSIEDLERQEKEELHLAGMNHAKGLTSDVAYQEQKNRIVVDFLQRRMQLYKQYGRPEDFEKTREKLTDTLNAQQLQKQKFFLEKLKDMRAEYEEKSAKERMEIELQMLEDIYNATDATGKRISDMTEAEFNRLKKLINLKYNGLDGNGGEVKDDEKKKVQDALKAAGHEKPLYAQPTDASVDLGFSGLVAVAEKLNANKEVYDNLKKMRDQDLIDNKTYTEACKQLDKERFSNFEAVAKAAYSSVSAIMSSASQLMQANAQLEEAKITKRYDKEIEAAGSNTAKGKKLEEQKQKEIAKVKTKYNKKQMAIEIAQAVAQTAMNALMAYGSVVKIPIVGPALAVAAAAAATAAGMIQIATIKKQHAAEAAGYYEGGFTGGNSYRRTAGVVHEGEFVANHQAVNNPNVLPILQLIDHAQRTNRIASLTAADVSRAIAAPMTTSVNTGATASAPALQVVDKSSAATADTLQRLNEQLDKGIKATVVIDGPDGLDRQWRNYNKMKQQ